MRKETETQKVKVCIDTYDTLRKPTKSRITEIQQKLSNKVIELTAEELASILISPHPCYWLPAELNGANATDPWVSQQVFAIEFNNSLSLEAVVSRLQDYGITCNIIYATYSHCPASQEFCVVFILKEPLTDKKPRNEINRSLLMLFPEASKTCADPMRLLEGGNTILYDDYENLIHPLDIIYSGELHFLQGASKNTISRNMDKWGKNCISIINILDLQKNPHFEEILNYNYSHAAEEVKIFDDFLKGKVLNTKQLFGIATNLNYVSGGLKFMKEMMERQGLYSSAIHTLLQYVRNRDYPPLPLEYFSPYKEDLIHKNILTAVKPPKGSVRRLEVFTTITRDEGIRQLETIMKHVKECNDTKVHIVCAPTGLGKTKLIEDWENVLIAFPDHVLKEEVVTRMKSDCVFTPNLQDFLSEMDKPLIDHLYRVGAVNYASKYINTKRKVSDAFTIDSPEWAYEEYRKAMAKCSVGNKTVLTTHAKVQYMTIRHGTIIFDEDPLSTAFLMPRVTYQSDLLRVGDALQDRFDKKAMSDLYKFVRSSHEAEIIPLPQFPFKDMSAIEHAAVFDTEIQGNILDFLTCPYFIKDPKETNKLYFIKKFLPPEDRKVIILSATADEFIYKQLIGDGLVFHNVGQVEPKGTLKQDTSFTFGRMNLGNQKIREYAAHRAEGRKVITFKSYRDEFKDAYDDLYFGFCQGRDTYYDNLMAIIGTPHMNPVIYKLYAKELNMDVKPEDFKPMMQLVHRKGLCFWFYTFKNEELRNLHLYLIEQELRQAIGRARLIWKSDADVLLLSNYPLPEAKQLKEI